MTNVRNCVLFAVEMEGEKTMKNGGDNHVVDTASGGDSTEAGRLNTGMAEAPVVNQRRRSVRISENKAKQEAELKEKMAKAAKEKQEADAKKKNKAPARRRSKAPARKISHDNFPDALQGTSTENHLQPPAVAQKKKSSGKKTMKSSDKNSPGPSGLGDFAAGDNQPSAMEGTEGGGQENPGRTDV